MFDVCPNEYTNDIRPNLEAAIRDGPVLLTESILKDQRFKDFIAKERVNYFSQHDRVNSSDKQDQNTSIIRRHNIQG